MDNGENSYRRFLGGDNSGFVELVCEYRDGLILYVNGIVKNLAEAEDIAEETFVRLGCKKPKFSGKASFKTWLYTIAGNLALDRLRKMKREALTDISKLYTLEDEEQLEKIYFHEEQKLILHNAIKKLKTDYARILRLIYFEKMSVTDAAKVRGRTHHATEMLLSRARNALKKELEKEGFTNEDL